MSFGGYIHGRHPLCQWGHAYYLKGGMLRVKSPTDGKPKQQNLMNCLLFFCSMIALPLIYYRVSETARINSKHGWKKEQLMRRNDHNKSDG